MSSGKEQFGSSGQGVSGHNISGTSGKST